MKNKKSRKWTSEDCILYIHYNYNITMSLSFIFILFYPNYYHYLPPPKKKKKTTVQYFFPAHCLHAWFVLKQLWKGPKTRWSQAPGWWCGEGPNKGDVSVRHQ